MRMTMWWWRWSVIQMIQGQWRWRGCRRNWQRRTTKRVRSAQCRFHQGHMSRKDEGGSLPSKLQYHSLGQLNTFRLFLWTKDSQDSWTRPTQWFWVKDAIGTWRTWRYVDGGGRRERGKGLGPMEIWNPQEWWMTATEMYPMMTYWKPSSFERQGDVSKKPKARAEDR